MSGLLLSNLLVWELTDLPWEVAGTEWGEFIGHGEPRDDAYSSGTFQSLCSTKRPGELACLRKSMLCEHGSLSKLQFWHPHKLSTVRFLGPPYWKSGERLAKCTQANELQVQ